MKKLVISVGPNSQGSREAPIGIEIPAELDIPERPVPVGLEDAYRWPVLRPVNVVGAEDESVTGETERSGENKAGGL